MFLAERTDIYSFARILHVIHKVKGRRKDSKQSVQAIIRVFTAV